MRRGCIFSSVSTASSSFLHHPRHVSVAASVAVAGGWPANLKNICRSYRCRALSEARRVLIDYLHFTRSVPFIHAEQIVLRSPASLSALLSQVPFPSHIDIPGSLRRYLRYHPLDEFTFFLESIGLAGGGDGGGCHLFLSDDAPLIQALTVLVAFGFPWNHLGLLYPSIFRSAPGDLLTRLHSLESLGMQRVPVMAACLAFPSLLTQNNQSDNELLLRDMKSLVFDFDLPGESVDEFLSLFRRIQMLYDLGMEAGSLGRNAKLFYLFHDKGFPEKLHFLTQLGMGKEAAGMYILHNLDILSYDIQNSSIVMPEYLTIAGVDEEELESLSRKYPYAMGTNRFSNLPGSLRSMNLSIRFLRNLLSCGHHCLNPAQPASISGGSLESEDFFKRHMDYVSMARRGHFVREKLEFLLGIGFGRNKITARVLTKINGRKSQLQERFDSLLDLGIVHGAICRMINSTPKLLNQSREKILEKVRFLCEELNYPLNYLEKFPAYLCFDLENRIKRRYGMLKWLDELGLVRSPSAPATVVATSEKKFIVHLYSLHPAAPKHWLERFAS